MSTKTLLFSFAFLLSALLPVVAQQSFGGKPVALPGTKSALQRNAEDCRSVDLHLNSDDLRAQADWKQSSPDGGAPVIGRRLKFEWNLAEVPVRATVGNVAVRRLQIKAPDANGIMLYYDDFFIPAGARLFVFTPDEGTILGAYTHETNPEGGAFATDALPGSEVILQYESPAGLPSPRVKIAGIGYLFAGIPELRAEPPTHPGEFSSDACMVNATCSEGEAWKDERNGVVQILQTAGDVITYCSGTLLNNTREDFAPLIISAGHCRLGRKFDKDPIMGTQCLANEQDFKQWIYRFRYYRPNCEDNDYAERYSFTLTGAQMLAFLSITGQSDGLLVRLLKDIPDYYGAYYNGWDRSDIPSLKGVGLHHPRGDAMKISTYTTPLTTDRWPAYKAEGAPDAHWLCIFAATEHGHGVTQSGSSGSALFNADHLLTGTLTGGGSQCHYVSGKNYYGKLAYHWDHFKNDADTSRMDIHLDPKSRGAAIRMKGAYRPGSFALEAPRSLSATFPGSKSPHLSWQTPEGALNQSPLTGYRLTIHTFAPDGQVMAVADRSLPGDATSFIDEKTNFAGAASVRYSLTKAYIPHTGAAGEGDVIKESRPVTVSLPLSEHATVSAVDVRPVDGGGTRISWQKPVNYQVVSRLHKADAETVSVGELSYADKKVNKYKTLYFGTRYPGRAFDTEQKPVRLIGVRFVSPRSSRIHSDKVYVRNGLQVQKDADGNYFPKPGQGNVVDSIPIPGELLRPGKWSTFIFPHPYILRSSDMLTVALQITTETDFMKDVIAVDTQKPTLENPVDNVFSFDGYRFSPMTNSMPKAAGNAMALELILDNAAADAPMPGNVPGNIPRASLPSVFPAPVSYQVHRNGECIATVEATGGELMYADAAGKTGDTYTVLPVYSDGSIADAVRKTARMNRCPDAYPTVFTDDIAIVYPELLKAAYVYSIAGQLLCSFPSGTDRLSLAHLAPGAYVLSLSATDGKVYPIRIVKL